MKSAFKILPQNSTDKTFNLLVEAGRAGIALLWYSKDPLTVEGISVYQSQKNIADTTLAEDVQKLLASENIPHYNAVTIFYNFKETLLVPNEYYNEDSRKEMLDLVYGSLPGSQYFAEPVKGVNATNIYKVPSAVHEVLSNRFFAAATKHSNSCVNAYADKDLYCVIYNSYIKVILYKNSKLQLTQFYDYNIPADVAYHLLNICTQHQLSASEITLTLSGFIDEQSNLYEELYRYFLNIKMDEIADDIQVSDEIKTHPNHFFSFLINLVKCAS